MNIRKLLLDLVGEMFNDHDFDLSVKNNKL